MQWWCCWKENLITGLYDLDGAVAHTRKQQPPSKYISHQDECVTQQIMSSWAAVGWKLQREMGNHKVNVIGGEGGLLWMLSYQSPPHNNVFGQELVMQGAKPQSQCTLQQRHTQRSCPPWHLKAWVFFNKHLLFVSTATSSLLRIKRAFVVWWCCCCLVVVSAGKDVVGVKYESPIHLYGFPCSALRRVLITLSLSLTAC